MKRIVILGAGTAGTIMANRLSRLYRSEIKCEAISITIVDQQPVHLYQPGLLFIPFGVYQPSEIVRQQVECLPDHVTRIESGIDRLLTDSDEVVLTNGQTLPYDALIIATGTEMAPEETEGLTGPGWGERMFEFYTLDGAVALAEALERWEGGRLVVDIVDMPIKCPVAPLEFAFLADWYFTKRGIRDKVDITYVTPLPLIVQLHIIGNWVLIAFFPFTRLVHVLVIPNMYLWRKTQVVRWNWNRRQIRNPNATFAERGGESRRD